MRRSLVHRLPLLCLAVLLAGASTGALAETGREHVPVTAEEPAGRSLVERLKAGGLVLFFRHADTFGMPCDSTFRVDDRSGQRLLSERGREQSRRIGRAVRDLAIPVALPVLAGPVWRARQTAEEAFSIADVRVDDGLTADDFAGARLAWVLAEHRRLLSEAVRAGTNRVLVGHRTPVIMVLGPAVGGRALPEGGAVVIEPRDPPRVLGVLMLAPIPGAGFHGC